MALPPLQVACTEPYPQAKPLTRKTNETQVHILIKPSLPNILTKLNAQGTQRTELQKFDTTSPNISFPGPVSQ